MGKGNGWICENTYKLGRMVEILYLSEFIVTHLNLFIFYLENIVFKLHHISIYFYGCLSMTTSSIYNGH